MAYNVGDRVLIRDDMDVYGDEDIQFGLNEDMEAFFGTTMTIADIEPYGESFIYRMEEDDGEWNWSEDMFDGKEVVEMKKEMQADGFKVGDIVTIVDNLKKGRGRFDVYINERMLKHAGKTYTILGVMGGLFTLDMEANNVTGLPWVWSSDCFKKEEDVKAPKKAAKAKHNPQAITTLDKLDKRSLFRVGGLFEGKARVCKVQFIDANDGTPSVVFRTSVGDFQKKLLTEKKLMELLESGEVTIMCIERG